jgi:acetylornithine deacetylase
VTSASTPPYADDAEQRPAGSPAPGTPGHGRAPLPHDASSADITAAVLAAVDDGADDAIDLLDRLVAIPSTGGSRAEVEIQHVLADLLHGEGFDVDLWRLDLDALTADPGFPGMEVERTEAYGLVATLQGHAPDLGRSLLVDGHTDVVPPGDPAAWSGDPYVMRRVERDGREALLGRGVCDMKAGLVASIAAVRAVRTLGLRLAGDLTIAPVVGEEDGGLGTFALLQRGVTADACIVPEPTDLDVVPANGGALTFRLRVPGAAIHASRRTEGVSAIAMFVHVLEALERFEAARNAEVDPLLRRWPLAYPLSIGTVQAGDWASTVPDLLVAEGRLGVALHESTDDARAALEDCVAQACAAHPFLRSHPVTVQWWGGQFAPGRCDDPQLVDLVQRAHRAAAPDARPQEVYGAPYGSDLRLLAPHLPTLQYGPGDTREAHAPDESVWADDVRRATRALALMYLEHCRIV